MKVVKVTKIVEESQVKPTPSPTIKTATPAETAKVFTAADMLQSGAVGLWKNRKDIKDSVDYAQELREKAEKREV